jgi:hypothetical protein
MLGQLRSVHWSGMGGHGPLGKREKNGAHIHTVREASICVCGPIAVAGELVGQCAGIVGAESGG